MTSNRPAQDARHPTPTVPPQPPTTTRDGEEPWTEERIRALGAITDLPTAASVFGLGRALAYQLARNGQFPIPVLRVGNRYRVAVAAILTALQLPAEPSLTPTTAAPDNDGLGSSAAHGGMNTTTE
ncbi:DNA-binding protein [Dactylosporangium sp. NPDC050688]|uniref:DNA-binding protein n=1 Tax=Dactylosporangium sp. NPDC050688 TaxID=3157217 RepID=UPI003404E2A4